MTRRIGVAGVIWGTTISYIAFSAIPMLFYVPSVLNRMESSARRVKVCASNAGITSR
jgi:hypothetical protein